MTTVTWLILDARLFEISPLMVIVDVDADVDTVEGVCCSEELFLMANGTGAGPLLAFLIGISLPLFWSRISTTTCELTLDNMWPFFLLSLWLVVVALSSAWIVFCLSDTVFSASWHTWSTNIFDASAGVWLSWLITGGFGAGLFTLSNTGCTMIYK